MYKPLILVAVSVLLVAADPTTKSDELKKELADFQGRWVATSQEYGGEKSPAERDQQSWHFFGERLTRYIDSKKVEVCQFEIQTGEKPKHLDLIPIPGEKGDEKERLLTRTKALYALEGDELRVAFTFEFLPGTPEEEKKRANEYAKTRPKSFDTTKGDVGVVTFKRAKENSK